MHTILVICASDTATIELPPQPYPLAAGSCSGGPWAHYLYYTIDPGLYYLWYAARSVKLKAPQTFFTLLYRVPRVFTQATIHFFHLRSSAADELMSTPFSILSFSTSRSLLHFTESSWLHLKLQEAILSTDTGRLSSPLVPERRALSAILR